MPSATRLSRTAARPWLARSLASGGPAAEPHPAGIMEVSSKKNRNIWHTLGTYVHIHWWLEKNIPAKSQKDLPYTRPAYTVNLSNHSDAPEICTVLPFITSIAVLTMFPTAGSLSATRSIMSAGTCWQRGKSKETPSCMASLKVLASPRRLRRMWHWSRFDALFPPFSGFGQTHNGLNHVILHGRGRLLPLDHAPKLESLDVSNGFQLMW